MIKIITLIVVFIGIIMTFFRKKKNLVTLGWGITSLGWLILSIINLISGNILFSVINFMLSMGCIPFFIIYFNDLKNGDNN